MNTTNQLPEPELGYIQTDKSNQPAFSARQMREAMKHAPYSALSDVPVLKNFVVLYRDESTLPADPPLAFQCWAENSDHAEEQCGNAYPGCTVAWVWQGPYGTGTDAAFSDYFGQEPITTLQARAQVQCELEPYDAGLLNDFGGGNVEWWQDYIRAELGRAHDFYQSQIAAPQPAQATQTEVTDFDLQKLWLERFTGPSHDPVVNYARSILALRPVHVNALAGCNCRWDGDNQVEWCELHLAHKEAIHEWAERAKSAEQKLALRPVQAPMTDEQVDAFTVNGRLHWLGKRQLIRGVEAYYGITAQAKKETP